MVSVDYKQDLRKAGISGIAFLLLGFFAYLFFAFFLQFLPFLKIDFNVFSKYYYFFGSLFFLLQSFLIYNFYKGYFVIGEKFNLPSLTKISKFMIIFFIITNFLLLFYINYLIHNFSYIFLNSQNMTVEQLNSFMYSFLSFFVFVLIFAIIFGILNIFLGREVLKLQDNFNTLALVSGYSKIILGIGFVSILFFSLAVLALQVSFISDILLFFETSKINVSSKKVNKFK